MPHRVLIVAGDATESLDTWYPYHRLREEGIEVHIGAPAKKVLNSVIHDFEPGWDTYVEKPGYQPRTSNALVAGSRTQKWRWTETSSPRGPGWTCRSSCGSS